MRSNKYLPLIPLLCLSQAAFAQQSGDFTYSSSGGSITITNYTGAGGAVVVPATIAGLPVNTIGEQAFRESSLTSVVLPNSLSAIGSAAFYRCNGLKSVTLPGNLTSIGTFAFQECVSLKSVTLPDSLTTIGLQAFSGCSDLNTVSFGNNLSTIGRHAFFSCRSLISLSFPDSLTSIGVAAFGYCSGMTSVTFGSGLTTVGEYAFSECTGIATATFKGNAPGSFGEGVFNLNAPGFTIYYRNNRTGFTTPLWQGYPTLPIDFTYSISDGSVTVDQYTGAGGTVKVPPTIEGLPVTRVGNEAFHSVASMTGVTLPDSVNYIGWGAFAHCTGLAAVNLGNGLDTIDDSAFYNCGNLKGVILPASVTSIQNAAFRGTGLTSALFLGNAPASFGSIVFYDTTTEFTVYYYGASTNFTSPLWKGYPAVDLVNPSPLHGWRMLHFGMPVDSGLAANDADPDGDGHGNLIEYAFGLDPRSGSDPMITAGTRTRGRPLVTVIPQTGTYPRIRIEYIRRKAEGGIRYIPQCSTTLGAASWTPLAGSEVVTAVDADWERVTVDDASSNQPSHFGRVKVELLPN